MNITIHRGTHQIGGCVTEYEHNGWRLFVDYGEQLPDVSTSDKPLEIEGLTYGDISKSALLITHYHGDHVGMISGLPIELPIYMGSLACEIVKTFSNHCSTANMKHKMLAERLNDIKTFSPGESFEFGEFKIMPVTIDHSAFDAYAFKIEAGRLKVFHSGDFRTHGFRSKKLPKVIDKYVGRVNYMVCEATNVLNHDSASKSEYELQDEFENLFREHKYNIVYVSSTNIDRLFCLYNAALSAGRPFYVDSYQKRMMDIVTKRDNMWGKSNYYNYKEYTPIELKRDGNEFLFKPEFDKFLDEKGYVLIARANDAFDNLISKMPGDNKQIYLSMWDGYVDPAQRAFRENLSKSVGKDYCYKHTSGHCDMESLGKLIEQLSPKAIIPIHTNDPHAFAKLFCDRWPVLLLNDGDTFSPDLDYGHEYISAEIIGADIDEKSKSSVEIGNDGGYKWWNLSQKSIGEFRNTVDALDALRHTVYAPDRTIGYAVESANDYSISKVTVYNQDFSVLAQYKHGGHAPRGSSFQEPCRFNKGEKVLAAIAPCYNALIPCEIVGPVTDNLMRDVYKHDDLCPFNSYREFKNTLDDWDWDSVAVHPFVRLKTGLDTMQSVELVQRVYLFPYRDFDIPKNP